MATLKGLRIMFADDETYHMRGTIEALENAGAKVDVVTGGTKALEYLRKHETKLPDLLILDIMMPGGPEIQSTNEGRTTGVEVFKWMQRENITIPTVVSTVVTDPLILKIFREHKIPIVEKPYWFEDLVDQIDKVLNEREKQ
jgi:CheY-like chemotaxis protein